MWLEPMSCSDFIIGWYERACAETLKERAKPGAFCLDLGANLGYFSLFLSRLVGQGGKVVAFEPMPENLKVLRENAELSDGNLSIVGAAVGDRSGEIELISTAAERYTKAASAVSYYLEGAAKTTTVPSLRLDEYFAGADRLPDLIKVDVEGAELAVLSGARETILRGKPDLVIEIHGWGSPEAEQVLGVLREFGYIVRVFGLRAREAHCLAFPASGLPTGGKRS